MSYSYKPSRNFDESSWEKARKAFSFFTNDKKDSTNENPKISTIDKDNFKKKKKKKARLAVGKWKFEN